MDQHKHTSYRSVLVLVVLSLLLLPPAPALAALGVTAVMPSIVSNDRTTFLAVTGTDFVAGAGVSLDGYGNLTTSFFSSTTLMAELPAGVPVGIYSVTVTNPDNTSFTLPGALTVIAQTATPQPTPTNPPPSGYERPVVVVQSYDTNDDRISPGDDFVLYVTLYNAGQHYATNVVASFTPGDLAPRGTGGVVAVGDIAPDNRSDFAQPLTVTYDVWGSIASLEMTLTYTDQDGIIYTERFTLTIPIYHPYVAGATATPTPTATGTPGLSMRPQIVITSYTTSVEPLQPGTIFKLSLSARNLGNANARRVSMIVGGGNASTNGTLEPGGVSGSGGEFTNFAPIGSSNVQSLGDLAQGASLSAEQSLVVNVSTAPGAYPMKISFVYVDESNHVFTDDQVITLLVYRLPKVEISFYRDPNPLYAQQPNQLPLQIVNLGRNSVVLGNMRVTAAGAQLSNNTILVGTLDTGGYFTLDATLIPDLPGSLDLLVAVDYTDDFNQQNTITATLTVEIAEMFIPEPIPGEETGGDGMPIGQPETFLQKVWRFILGMIGLDSAAPTNTGSPAPAESIPENQAVPVEVSPPLKGP